MFSTSLDAVLISCRYGIQVARLSEAHAASKKAYDVARRGRASTAVVKDTQAFAEMLQKEITKSERDNDLIYHHEVPSLSGLQAILPADLANPEVPPGLLNPDAYLEKPLFGQLVSWATREAISALFSATQALLSPDLLSDIYNDRKRKLVEQKVEQAVQGMKSTAREVLQNHRLPASLDALQKPVGLPPSLIGKAEEVQSEDGPNRVERGIEDVRTLAVKAGQILEEVIISFVVSLCNSLMCLCIGIGYPR